MIKAFIISLFILTPLAGFTQLRYVDSLETLKAQPVPDTVKVWALNELSREYFYLSPEKSLSLANEALELSRKIEFKRGEAYAYRMLASMSAFQEHYLEYTELLNKAIAIFTELNDSQGLGNCFLSEGVTYNLQLNFTKSIDAYTKALQLFRATNNEERIAVCLNNMGFVYYRMNKLDESVASLNESIEINRRLDNKSVLMDSYENLGLVYHKQGGYEQAEEQFKKVFELNDLLKDKANAEAYVEALIYQALICKSQGRLDEQRKLLELAKEKAREFRYMQLMKDAFLQLSEYYIVTKDYTKAYGALRELNIVDDSLTRQRIQEKANMMTSVINSVKLETDFQHAKDDLIKQKLVIDQQSRTLWAVAFVGILFFVLIILLFVMNRSRKAMNSVLAAHRVAMANKNRELLRLNQTKDKFFSVVAHDLRSPLNSLQGFSSLLVKHADSLTKEDIQRMGSQLKDSVGNTLRMTDNLIAWARLQMQEENTNPEEIDLKSVVAETFGVFSEGASKKDIQLKACDLEDIKVYADRNQVLLILRNLVNNAIKYTKPGGEVKVCASRDEKGKVKIVVEDTGEGMEEAVIKGLFSLEQTVSRVGTSGERGTGLGLVMVKDFVERNKGSLEVESQLKKGSKFIITLPAAEG